MVSRGVRKILQTPMPTSPGGPQTPPFTFVLLKENDSVSLAPKSNIGAKFSIFGAKSQNVALNSNITGKIQDK